MAVNHFLYSLLSRFEYDKTKLRIIDKVVFLGCEAMWTQVDTDSFSPPRPSPPPCLMAWRLPVGPDKLLVPQL
jgi:hypothetical protein